MWWLTGTARSCSCLPCNAELAEPRDRRSGKPDRTTAPAARRDSWIRRSDRRSRPRRRDLGSWFQSPVPARRATLTGSPPPRRERSAVSGVALLAVGDRELGLEAAFSSRSRWFSARSDSSALTQRRLARALPRRDRVGPGGRAVAQLLDLARAARAGCRATGARRRRGWATAWKLIGAPSASSSRSARSARSTVRVVAGGGGLVERLSGHRRPPRASAGRR